MFTQRLRIVLTHRTRDERVELVHIKNNVGARSEKARGFPRVFFFLLHSGGVGVQ